MTPRNLLPPTVPPPRSHVSGTLPANFLEETIHLFTLVFGAIGVLDKGWMLVYSLNDHLAMLYESLTHMGWSCLEEGTDALDTLGGLVNSALISATGEAKSGEHRAAYDACAWGAALTDPESFLRTWDGVGSCDRIDPLPECQVEHCKNPALYYTSSVTLSISGISVESKRARVPPSTPLRFQLAHGGLSELYPCPVNWFIWALHPDLVILWSYYGRLTHYGCKTMRGHPLAPQWR
ncbi:hypothetical protein R3P38DRAFT_3196756 [Favolaschia claudopus]|uniref:Uncharacterized protein n=1 Tax=Favolaschia claudopus TaxID=2862362 RepID=A0AAW0B616_9AGAR